MNKFSLTFSILVIFMFIPSIASAQISSAINQEEGEEIPFSSEKMRSEKTSFSPTFLPFTVLLGFSILILLNAVFISSPLVNIKKEGLIKGLVRGASLIACLLFLISLLGAFGGSYQIEETIYLIIGIVILGFFVALAYFSFRDDWYSKTSISVGWAIISISIAISLIVIITTLFSSRAFLSGELEYGSRLEAFYKFGLPWLFRMGAMLTYGTMNLSAGHIYVSSEPKPSFKPLTKEFFILLSLIGLEIISSYLFGRRLFI